MLFHDSKFTSPLSWGALAGIWMLAACLPPAPKEAGFELGRQRSGKAWEPSRVWWGSRIQHTSGGEGEDAFPHLSPDAQTLYFSTTRFGKRFNLVSKPLHGHTLTFLTSGGSNDIFPALSPDGGILAFASDRDQGWDLYLLEPGSPGKVRRLVRSATDTLGPRWSPDGKSIVCFRRGGQGGEWEVWTIDVSSGAQTFLTEGLFPDWSPDGAWIAYQRPRWRGARWYSLWKIRNDGRQATELISGWNGDWGAVRPSWSPDGGWIAFIAVGKGSEARELGNGKGTLYTISAGGAQLINLTGDRPGISEWDPFFGRDGRIYFSSDEGGSINLWSIDSKLDRDGEK